MPSPIPRLATACDIAALQAIEVSAGESFRALGMDLVADDPPPAREVFERATATPHM